MAIGWPTTFTYVCSATNGLIVNAKPIADAGPDRIAKIVQFVGAPLGSDHEARYQREALRTAKLLKEWARVFFGRQCPPIQDVRGDPDVISDWCDRMQDLVGGGDPSELVVNLTGGTTAMKLGILLGRDQRCQVILVHGTPLRTEFVVGASQSIAPQHHVFSLADYLGLYGISETRDRVEARKKREGVLREHRIAIAKFSRALLDGGGNVQRVFAGAASRLFGYRGEFVGGLFNLAATGLESEVREVLDCLRGFPGLDFQSDGNVVVTHPDAGQHLRGGWLEACLFLALSDALASRNDAEVATGVRLQYADKNSVSRPELGEIDVAVMIGGQLHIIEAKAGDLTGASSAKTTGPAIAKLEQLKRNLLGQVGRAALCAPRETDQSLEASGDFLQRCRQAGITVRTGPRAVERIVEIFRNQL